MEQSLQMGDGLSAIAEGLLTLSPEERHELASFYIKADIGKGCVAIVAVTQRLNLQRLSHASILWRGAAPLPPLVCCG